MKENPTYFHFVCLKSIERIIFGLKRFAYFLLVEIELGFKSIHDLQNIE